MGNVCNVNGRITPETQAVIPVLDRGFLFGDSIYETFKTVEGIPFAFARHMERLHASAARLRFEVPLSDAAMAARIKVTIAAAGGGGERYIRIIVTRGVSAAPNIDPAHARGQPNLVILVRDLEDFPPEMYERGIALAIPSILRNDRRALDPAIKSGNYLNNILGLMEAKERGANDAVFLNTSQEVSESSTSNVGIVRDGRVATPPLTAGILPGVTRAILLEAAARDGLVIHEQTLRREDLAAAQEVFLTSSLKGVMPVTRLDGRTIGDGKPGPLTRRLSQIYARRESELVLQDRAWWAAVPARE